MSRRSTSRNPHRPLELLILEDRRPISDQMAMLLGIAFVGSSAALVAHEAGLLEPTSAQASPRDHNPGRDENPRSVLPSRATGFTTPLPLIFHSWPHDELPVGDEVLLSGDPGEEEGEFLSPGLEGGTSEEAAMPFGSEGDSAFSYGSPLFGAGSNLPGSPFVHDPGSNDFTTGASEPTTPTGGDSAPTGESASPFLPFSNPPTNPDNGPTNPTPPGDFLSENPLGEPFSPLQEGNAGSGGNPPVPAYSGGIPGQGSGSIAAPPTSGILPPTIGWIPPRTDTLSLDMYNPSPVVEDNDDPHYFHLATFTHLTDLLAEFTAIIHWGDGTTPDSSSLEPDIFQDIDACGTATIGWHHVYPNYGAYIITVTVEGPGGPVSDNVGLLVYDAPLHGQSRTFETIEVPTLTPNHLAGGLYDDAGRGAGAEMRGFVEWGDGSFALGNVSTTPPNPPGPPGPTPPGPVGDIRADHDYTRLGDYDVRSRVVSQGGSSAFALNHAEVAVNDAYFTIPNSSAHVLAGVPFTISLGGFDKNYDGTLRELQRNDYRLTIDWTDGTTSTGAPNAYLVGGTVGPQVLMLVGSHTYASVGMYHISVTVTQIAPETHSWTTYMGGILAGNSGPADSFSLPPAVVTDRTMHLQGTPRTINQGESPGSVATYSGPVAQGWIAWYGTADQSASISGGVLSGYNTYGGVGAYGVRVKTEDWGATPNSPSWTTTMAWTSVVVKDWPISSQGVTLSGQAGMPLFDVLVANFTDTAPNSSPYGFSAVINWGDGTSSAGSLMGGYGGFQVRGNHTYNAAGLYKATVYIVDQQGYNRTLAETPISIAPTGAGSGTFFGNIVPFTITEGQQFEGVVAEFTDATPDHWPAPGQVPVQTARITWGDGTESAALVEFLGNGAFRVLGRHVYTSTVSALTGLHGAHSLKVTIDYAGAPESPLLLHGSVLVNDAALTPEAVTITPDDGVPLINVPVLRVHDANPFSRAEDYTATIYWGDGTSSPGLVLGYGGEFFVAGNHTYEHPGKLRFLVVLQGPSWRTVAVDKDVLVAAGSAWNPTYLDPGTLTKTAHEVPWGYRFEWGDGSVPWTRPGTWITGVRPWANHIYEAAGDYSLYLNVLDNNAEPSGSGMSRTIPVAPALPGLMTTIPGRTTGSPTIKGVRGKPREPLSSGGSRGGVALAAFADIDPYTLPGSFTATIWWGDGSQADVGTIEAVHPVGPGDETLPPEGTPFVIWGQHTYVSGGTYPIVILLHDKQGNVKTLSGTTATIDDVDKAIQRRPGTRLEVGTDTSTDGGQATVAPNTGTLQVYQPLDFRLSHDSTYDGFIDVNGHPLQGLVTGDDRHLQAPLQAVEGYRGGFSALIYNSDQVSVQPLAEVHATFDPHLGVPEQLKARLIWNAGNITEQAMPGWRTFTTYGHAPGDTYLLGDIYRATEAPITESGVYPWTVDVQATFFGGLVVEKRYWGSAHVVVQDSSQFGAGWTLDGLNQIVVQDDGVLLIYGSGDASRFFKRLCDGSYASPPEDFGKLRKVSNTQYEYTSKHTVTWTYDVPPNQFGVRQRGRLTLIQDPHGLSSNFTYDTTDLFKLNTMTWPGGVTVTFTASAIQLPGSRTLTLGLSAQNRLTAIADVDGTSRAFAYDARQHLTSMAWGDTLATYSYDPDFGVLDHVDRGLGTTWGINPQNRVPLLAVPAAHWDRDSVAKVTDPRNYPSNYVFDRLGWVEKLTTPDGEKQRWFRDPGEQVAFFFDQLQRPTGYQHDGSGDLLKVQYPDRALRSFVYAGPFHHLSSFIDANKYETRYFYNNQGDRTLTIDALDYPTIYSWDAALLRDVTNARGFPTYFTHDAQRRLILTLDAFLSPTHFTYDAAGYLSLTTDALSHATQTHHDERGRLTATTDALTNTTAWDYNAVGQVTRTTDAFPRVTEYKYDQRAWQTKQIEAAHTSDLARTTLRAYDVAGNLTSTIARRAYDNGSGLEGAVEPATREDAYAYDVVNRRTQMTEAVNVATAKRLTDYGYDPVGNLLWVDRPRDYETPLAAPTIAGPKYVRTSYGYDARARQTLVLEAVGTDLQRSTKTKYDREGHVVLIADPLDRWTIYDYDALYRSTCLVEAANQTPSRTTWNDYDPVGNLTEVQDALERLTKYIYDPVDRLIAMTEAVGTDVQRTTSYAYDVVGNLIGEHRPRFHDNETVPAGEYRTILTSSAYDALNRLTKTEEAADVPVGIWNPQPDGRVITLLPHARPVTEIAYDDVGHVTLVTDPLGRKTRYDYDALDRRTATVEDWQGGTNESDRRTAWTFDAADNLRSETHGLGTSRPHWSTISYAYDIHNRRTRTQEAVNAQAGLTPLGHGPPQTFVIYDAADNAVRTTDPRGTQFDSVYDVLHRLDTRIDAVNHPTTLTRRTLYDYDLADRLIALSTPQKYDHEGALFLTTSYAYDELDRQTLTSEGEATGLHRSTQRAYDILDNLTLSTDALGVDTRYAYDKLDRLTRVTEAANHAEQKRVSLKKYDAADNLIGELRPRLYGERDWTSTAEQATTTSYLYDALNRPASVIAAANQTEAALGHLPPATQTRYDIGGRVLLVLQPPREAVLEASTWSLSTSYSYDRLDRQTLIEEGAYVFGTSPLFNVYRSATRLFDAADNLTQETTGLAPANGLYPGNPATTNYNYDALNRLAKKAEAVGTAVERWTVLAYEVGGQVVLETRSPKYEGELSQDADLATKRQTAYDYDALGRRTQVTEAWALLPAPNQALLGHPSPVTTTKFNAADNITRVVNPRSVVTDYAYDALNRRTRIEEAAEGTVAALALPAAQRPISFVYADALDRVTQTIDSLGTVANYHYDVLGRLDVVDEAVNRPEDHRQRQMLYNAQDRMERDGRGLEGPAERRREIHTTYLYDALGRQTQVLEGAHLTAEQLAAYNHARPTTETFYDAVGNVVEVRNPLVTTRYKFDHFNRRKRTQEGDNDPANRRVTTADYDAVGNVLFTWDGRNVKTLFGYDQLNRQTSVSERAHRPADEQIRTTLVHNAFDEVTERITQLGTTSYVYDRLGRQRTTVFPRRSDTLPENGHQTFLKYDPVGNRTEVRDRFRHLFPASQPPGGEQTVEDVSGFAFDALNRVTRATDPNQNFTTYAYDKLGRVTEVSDRNAPGTGSFPFVREVGRARDYAYDAHGHLIQERWFDLLDASGTPDLVRQMHYQYDSSDHLIRSSIGASADGPREQTLRHDRSYDDFNRLKTDQGAFGPMLTYRYDVAHRLAEVWQPLPGGGSSNIIASKYDVASRLVERSYGGAPARSVTLDYKNDPITGKLDLVGTMTYYRSVFPLPETLYIQTLYDYYPTSDLKEIDYRQGEQSLEFLSTVYWSNTSSAPGYFAAAGLVYDETRASNYGLLFSPQKQYFYDQLGQVSAISSDQGGSVPEARDDNGNPQDRQLGFGNRPFEAADGRLLQYDDEGNLLRWVLALNPIAQTSSEIRYQYDHANHLVRVEGGTYRWGPTFGENGWWDVTSVSDFTYDAEGRLVKAVTPEGEERYAYDGAEVWADVDSAGQPLRRYLRGDSPDQLFGRKNGNNSTDEVYWYLTDRQHSVLRLISDTDGSTKKILNYDRTAAQYPGEPAAVADRYEYTGRPTYGGLQYNRARWYHPGVSRWLTEDPLGFAAGDTNLYRYVGNSHPNLSDPSGLSSEDWARRGRYVSYALKPWASMYFNADQMAADLHHLTGGWSTEVLLSEGFTTTLNATDQFFAGWSHQLTFGLSTLAREAMYGELATRNHEGAFFNAGQVLGFVHSLVLPIGSLVKGVKHTVAAGQSLKTFAAVRGAGAAVGAGKGLTQTYLSHGESASGWDYASSGALGGLGGAVSPLAALVSTGTSLGAYGGAKLAGADEATARRAMFAGDLVGMLAGAGAQGYRGHGGSGPRGWSGVVRTVGWDIGGGVAGAGVGWLSGGDWLESGARGMSVVNLVQSARAMLQWACFAAGTPLEVPGGSKAVELFRVGDEILSRSEYDPNGLVEVKVVEEVFVRTGRILHLHVGGQVIRTTPEHPFFAEGRGWVQGNELIVGDRLWTGQGRWVAVEEVYDTGEYETVYNLKVADFHTYFVGCDEWGFSVWAHNAACTPEEIVAYADSFAKAAQANGGKVPRGVWNRIAPGRNLSEADKSAIRHRILSNPDLYPGVTIKPRGMGGPIGTPSTRTLDGDIAQHLKGGGWKLERGAGSGHKQEWIPGSGPGRTGGTAVDVTASRVVDGTVQRARVQTVTTLADGATPTLVEAAAAARIRAAFPNHQLILVPKGAEASVWQALLAGL